MEQKSRRTPGGPLSPHERSLLDVLCSGNWPGAKEARGQVPLARWGGWQFEDEDCECFLVAVPEDVDLPRIPPHPGGPFASIEVVDEADLLGHLDLWTQDGVLHSVDYMTFGAPDERLPALEQLGDEAFAYWFDQDPATE